MSGLDRDPRHGRTRRIKDSDALAALQFVTHAVSTIPVRMGQLDPSRRRSKLVTAGQPPIRRHAGEIRSWADFIFILL
jgi:hypothetical protein